MSSEIVALSDALPNDECVLAYGHFSSIHPGHIRYLKHAAAQGSPLMVALIGDNQDGERINGNGLPFRYPQIDRAEGLKLLNLASSILMLKGNELSEAIHRLQPAVLVLGTEHQRSRDPAILRAKELMRQLGRDVMFHAGDTHYATAELLRDSESGLARGRQDQFRRACERQGLELDTLLRHLHQWSDTRLAVVGDTIVDQYTACEAVGMSAEAPVVVVRELEDRVFIGGAGVVASHVRALGAQCELVSVVGMDGPAELVSQRLAEQGIGNSLIEDASRPTTFKKRYLVGNQKLFRVSRMEEHMIFPEVEDQLIARLEDVAGRVDGLIVSDFVYGVITDRVLETIQDLARRHDLQLYGDLQCSSQVGDITRFKDFALLCPNEREARMALQDKDAGLERLANQLIQSTGCQKLVMKLGSEGFIAYDRDRKGQLFNQHFPALSVNPLDVTGAGDSLLAVMAVGLSAGHSIMTTAAIGCCMAALAVETLGNIPIGVDRLQQQIQSLLDP
jgi:rfaE bifunctional protein kinase chain/domain